MNAADKARGSSAGAPAAVSGSDTSAPGPTTSRPDTPAGLLIGVLGATGSVGLAALRELRAMGFTDLRLGGRRTAALHGVADELGGACEPFTVDADDPEALRSFARGCAVVLNCAGPTYRLV
ncbi:MAG TPA: saccharopine dehydrogenase NADP-binding domain-containing protein, partial [Yinghuangia sp.]|nr:saccharopine dehydrogenase NADP-binding domain-containing protein [Yinghuangia sp.]